jgi:hypothetical protein
MMQPVDPTPQPSTQHLQILSCLGFNCAGGQGAVVAVVQGQLVAMAAITPAVDLQLLQDNFNLTEGLPPGCCSNTAAHTELDVCVVNPVFTKSVGALLAGTVDNAAVIEHAACTPVCSVATPMSSA